MVVMVLILLGVGIDKAQAGDRAVAEPEPATGAAQPDARLPEIVTERTIAQWRYHNAALDGWMMTKRTFVELDLAAAEAQAPLLEQIEAGAGYLPGKFRNIFTAHVKALKQGKPIPLVECPAMIEALDELEALGLFDRWIAAYLWRRTSALAEPPQRKELAAVYARIERHTRIADTLIRSQAAAQPVPISPRAWRSKAGPSHWQRRTEQHARQAILVTAKRLYPKTDAGTWDDDAVVRLVVAEGSPAVSLRRAGGQRRLKAGDLFEFRRLDVVEVSAGGKPAVLRHVWLGPIELPADRLIAVWDLPGLLSPGAKAKVQETVDQALSGDEQAAEQLEVALPLSHRAVRAAVAEKRDAPGAARLRMILTLFDDTVVRHVAQPVPLRTYFRPPPELPRYPGPQGVPGRTPGR
jgi:hypothetical protein